MNTFIVESMKGTIYEDGSGMIPKKVMTDKSLAIESKAIYAYLCSYAWGNTSNERKAFPTVERMVNDLNMSENRFYKHRKPLLDSNLISIKKITHDNGIKNIYSITAPLNLINSIKKGDNLQNRGNLQIEGNLQNAHLQNEYLQNEGGNKRNTLIKESLNKTSDNLVDEFKKLFTLKPVADYKKRKYIPNTIAFLNGEFKEVLDKHKEEDIIKAIKELRISMHNGSIEDLTALIVSKL